MSSNNEPAMTTEQFEIEQDGKTQRHEATCQTVTTVFRSLFGFAAIPATAWASQYAADALAGHTTGLNITISIGLTIGLGGTAAATGWWARHQKKRADASERQNGKLTRQNAKLLQERNALRQQLVALEGRASQS